MIMRLLLENLEYILTVDKDRRVIKNGSIVIEDTKINRLGKSVDISGEFGKGYFDQIIDCAHGVAVPGFVNTHVHTHEHLARGLFPDSVNTGAWTSEWAYPFYGNTTEEEEYISALLCCAEMLKTGTTCFLESGARFPKSVVRALEKIGIRGIVGKRVMDKPPSKTPVKWDSDLIEKLYFSYVEDALSETRKTIEMCRQQNNERIRGWVTINGKDTCTDELYIKAAKLSLDQKVGMHFHMASSLKEAEKYQKEKGMWPFSYLNSLGVLQSNMVVAHATMIADSEVRILKEKGVKLSFCPGSALKLAKGAGPYGKFPELLREGVTVSLGCDGAAASGSFDMVRQIYLACGIFKDSRLDETLIPAEQGLEMATLKGAEAVQWENEIGSLEEGKKADITIFDTNRIEWQPLHDPIQNLVYSASGESVSSVIINGQLVVKNGKITTIDEEELLELARTASLEAGKRSGLNAIHNWKFL